MQSLAVSVSPLTEPRTVVPADPGGVGGIQVPAVGPRPRPAGRRCCQPGVMLVTGPAAAMGGVRLYSTRSARRGLSPATVMWWCWAAWCNAPAPPGPAGRRGAEWPPQQQQPVDEQRAGLLGLAGAACPPRAGCPASARAASRARQRPGGRPRGAGQGRRAPGTSGRWPATIIRREPSARLMVSGAASSRSGCP